MRKKLFKISGRHLLLLSHFLIFSFSQPLFAQTQPFTERLQKAVSGQGTVRLHQDADIVALVNGTARRSVNTTRSLLTSTDSLLSANDSLLMGTGRKVRMNGYRVQVYAGGNSRDAKRRAYQVEALVRKLFPEQPVYTRFVSPRWICHVGDFKTRAEALRLLKDMRRTGKFSEAITVRCKINAYVYEQPTVDEY
ncbi:MAG: SPOR domain-containing protein [Bacteroidaceae bacterium]|nr:SPOR domain-containing protein [Bacteroidaceae bacterium]